jgi:hypothetical protein
MSRQNSIYARVDQRDHKKVLGQCYLDFPETCPLLHDLIDEATADLTRRSVALEDEREAHQMTMRMVQLRQEIKAKITGPFRDYCFGLVAKQMGLLDPPQPVHDLDKKMVALFPELRFESSRHQHCILSHEGVAVTVHYQRVQARDHQDSWVGRVWTNNCDLPILDTADADLDTVLAQMRTALDIYAEV